MPYIELAKLHQLYDGYRRLIRIAGQEWLLIHEQGQSYLIHNACPHQGAPLVRATWVDGSLRCPQHGMVFNLATGSSINANCAQKLRSLPLVYEGNGLGIDVDS